METYSWHVSPKKKQVNICTPLYGHDVAKARKEFEQGAISKPQARHLWNVLKTAVFPQKQVPRSGTVLYGCLAERPLDVAESVGDHSFGLSALIMLVRMFFPYYFFNAEGRVIQKMALFHDVAEVKTGDIPDDGRPGHEEKLAREPELVAELLKELPPGERDAIVHFSSELQHEEKSEMSELVQSFWCADKAEAILYCLYLMSIGHPGCARHKGEQISTRDFEGCHATGEESAAAIWAYSYMVQSQKLPEKIYLLWDLLILTAAEDVYGADFRWRDWWRKKKKKK